MLNFLLFDHVAKISSVNIIISALRRFQLIILYILLAHVQYLILL